MIKNWKHRDRVIEILSQRHQEKENCERCGVYGVERHEPIFGTSNRQKCIEFSLFNYLCHEHHRGNTGAHHDKWFDLSLRIEAQSKFESACMEVGYTTTEARGVFLAEFGRNYLD